MVCRPAEAMQKCMSDLTKLEFSKEDKNLELYVRSPNVKLWTQIIPLKHCRRQTKHIHGLDVGYPFNNL